MARRDSARFEGNRAFCGRGECITVGEWSIRRRAWTSAVPRDGRRRRSPASPCTRALPSGMGGGPERDSENIIHLEEAVESNRCTRRAFARTRERFSTVWSAL